MQQIPGDIFTPKWKYDHNFCFYCSGSSVTGAHHNLPANGGFWCVQQQLRWAMIGRIWIIYYLNKTTITPQILARLIIVNLITAPGAYKSKLLAVKLTRTNQLHLRHRNGYILALIGRTLPQHADLQLSGIDAEGELSSHTLPFAPLAKPWLRCVVFSPSLFPCIFLLEPLHKANKKNRPDSTCRGLSWTSWWKKLWNCRIQRTNRCSISRERYCGRIRGDYAEIASRTTTWNTQRSTTSLSSYTERYCSCDLWWRAIGNRHQHCRRSSCFTDHCFERGFSESQWNSWVWAGCGYSNSVSTLRYLIIWSSISTKLFGLYVEIKRWDRNAQGWTPPYTMNYINNVIKAATITSPQRFLNLWVIPLSNNLLGYASFPSASGNFLSPPPQRTVYVTDLSQSRVGRFATEQSRHNRKWWSSYQYP